MFCIEDCQVKARYKYLRMNEPEDMWIEKRMYSQRHSFVDINIDGEKDIYG